MDIVVMTLREMANEEYYVFEEDIEIAREAYELAKKDLYEGRHLCWGVDDYLDFVKSEMR